MRISLPYGVLAITAAAFIAGCAKAPSTVEAASKEVTATATPTANDPADASPISLTDASHDDFRALLKKHEGRVIFVDYWATWCGNCMEEFPHTVELSEKHQDAGLAVISVAMEMDAADEETRKSVREFLTKQGAKFDNLLYAGDGTSEEATAGFEIDSPLPHFQLYDRTGKLIRKFTFSDPDNPISREDIDQAVAEALATPQ